MPASVISPDFQIRIFQPNTDSPLDFPMEYISSITSVRGLRGNSMTINFARDNKLNGLPYRAYFQDQSIVQLLVRRSPNETYRQENLCYVSAVSSQGTPNKRTESITISGFETKLRNQNLFLDIVNIDEDELSKTALNKADGNKAFVHTINKFGESLSNIVSMRKLFLKVYDDLIAELSNPHLGMFFGGNSIFKKSSYLGVDDKFFIYPFVMEDGYTTNFLHVLNFMSGYTIGANVNFWDIITSLECEPLYELFFDPLETTSNDKPILDPDFISNYEIKSDICGFIFRKTPFVYVMDYYGDWNRNVVSKTLPENLIKSLTCSFSQDNAYTGVHVGMSFLGNVAATLINHPSWHPILLSHFGYKPLRVMLDGVTFPKDKNITLEEIKLEFAPILNNMQSFLYKIFCQFPAMKAGNVDIETQFDWYRPGTSIAFDNPETDFGDVGYLESVTNSFQAKGQATTQLSLKWVDYKLKTDTSKQIKPPDTYNDAGLNQTNTA